MSLLATQRGTSLSLRVQPVDLIGDTDDGLARWFSSVFARIGSFPRRIAILVHRGITADELVRLIGYAEVCAYRECEFQKQQDEGVQSWKGGQAIVEPHGILLQLLYQETCTHGHQRMIDVMERHGDYHDQVPPYASPCIPKGHKP